MSPSYGSVQSGDTSTAQLLTTLSVIFPLQRGASWHRACPRDPSRPPSSWAWHFKTENPRPVQNKTSPSTSHSRPAGPALGRLFSRIYLPGFYFPGWRLWTRLRLLGTSFHLTFYLDQLPVSLRCSSLVSREGDVKTSPSHSSRKGRSTPYTTLPEPDCTRGDHEIQEGWREV